MVAMKGSPEKKAFWRLFSPLLAYWIVQVVFSSLLSFVMMIVKAKDLAPILFVDQENVTEAELQTVFDAVNKIAGEFYQQYQLECATASALCLILVMGIMFWQDRKREMTGQAAVAGWMPSAGQMVVTGRMAPAGQAEPVKRAVPASKYVLLLGLGVSFCLAANCLVGMTELAFTDGAYQEAAISYDPSFPLQVLCSGLVIPLSEELFYRGVIFKRFRERIGFVGAAFISAFVFSTSHGNLVQALYTIGLGMLLAYAYEKYGSFKAPLCLHVVTNVTLLVCTQMGVFDWLMQNKPWMAVLAVAGTFVGTMMFVNIQKVGEEPATIHPPADHS